MNSTGFVCQLLCAVRYNFYRINKEQKSYFCGQRHQARAPGFYMFLDHKVLQVLVLSLAFLKCQCFFSGRTHLRGCFLSPALPLFPLFYQCDRCLFLSSPCGSSWLGCQDFSSHGISLHLRASPVNNGNSWMSWAPNLHFARQPLILVFIPFSLSRNTMAECSGCSLMIFRQ